MHDDQPGSRPAAHDRGRAPTSAAAAGRGNDPPPLPPSRSHDRENRTRCERGRTSARPAGPQRNDPPAAGDGQGRCAGLHRTRRRQRLDRPGSFLLAGPEATANAECDHSAARGGHYPQSEAASVLPDAHWTRLADESVPEHRFVSLRSRSRRWSRWRSRTEARASRQGLAGSASGWIPRAGRQPARDQEFGASPSPVGAGASSGSVAGGAEPPVDTLCRAGCGRRAAVARWTRRRSATPRKPGSSATSCRRALASDGAAGLRASCDAAAPRGLTPGSG